MGVRSRSLLFHSSMSTQLLLFLLCQQAETLITLCFMASLINVFILIQDKLNKSGFILNDSHHTSRCLHLSTPAGLSEHRVLSCWSCSCGCTSPCSDCIHDTVVHSSHHRCTSQFLHLSSQSQAVHLFLFYSSCNDDHRKSCCTVCRLAYCLFPVHSIQHLHTAIQMLPVHSSLFLWLYRNVLLSSCYTDGTFQLP